MSAASELRGTAHHDQHWQVQTLCKESASMSSHFGVPLEALERPSRLARGLSAQIPSVACMLKLLLELKKSLELLSEVRLLSTGSLQMGKGLEEQIGQCGTSV